MKTCQWCEMSCPLTKLIFELNEKLIYFCDKDCVKCMLKFAGECNEKRNQDNPVYNFLSKETVADILKILGSFDTVLNTEYAQLLYKQRISYFQKMIERRIESFSGMSEISTCKDCQLCQKHNGKMVKHLGNWTSRKNCDCCYVGSDEMHYTCCNSTQKDSLCNPRKTKVDKYW